MNYFEKVKSWGEAIRADKGKVGAPYDNDNAAKDHVKEVIRQAKSYKAFKSLIKGRLTPNISKQEFAKVRSEVTNNYSHFEVYEGRTCAIFLADRPAEVNKGHCYFFFNGGMMDARAFYKIEIEGNQEFLAWLTERMGHS